MLKILLFILFNINMFANNQIINIKLKPTIVIEKEDVSIDNNSKIIVIDNGIVTCKDAIPGSFESLGSIKYYISIDKSDLINALNKYESNHICTTHIKDMSYLFYLSSFNKNISSWDTSNVLDMSYMFYENVFFNNLISYWNTSNVTNMSYMFYGASSFNKEIDKWDISKVKFTNSMFAFAKSFNKDISSWNTSNVLDMSKMFFYASSFNQNLSSWNLSSLYYMNDTFSGASNFDLNFVSNWKTKF